MPTTKLNASKTDLQPNEILEVSTASHDMEVGQALSALNLIYVDPITQESHPLENWFQASKVFIKDGIEMGPYIELLHIKRPKSYINPCPDKKTAERFQGDPLFDKIQSEIGGGQLGCFKLSGEKYPLIPKSAFYDYLYISALCQPQNKAVAEKLLNFRVFTDIMFNPGSDKKKKFNTQARSCAIFVALSKRGVLNCDIPTFSRFVQAVRYESETIF